MQKLSIAQASVELGISQDVIRRRLKSGKLEGHQEPCPGGFRWWVDLEDRVAQVNGQADDSVVGGDEGSGHVVEDGLHNGHQDSDLVEVLQDQVKRLDAHVEDLQHQLADRTREISELHQLLGARSLNPGVDRPWWVFWRRS